jgi:hypothetical protein
MGMKGSRWILFGAAAVSLLVGAGFQRAKKGDEKAEAKATVYAHELGKDVVVLSSLDEPLGSLLTLRGEMVEADYMSRNKVPPKPEERFRVFEVNERKLEMPVVIALMPKWFSARKPPAPSTRFEMVGYQTGEFAGMSPASAELYRRNGGMPASFGWHFSVEFIVKDHRELKPAE